METVTNHSIIPNYALVQLQTPLVDACLVVFHDQHFLGSLKQKKKKKEKEPGKCSTIF